MAGKSRKSKPVQNPLRIMYLMGAVCVLTVIAYWYSFDAPFVFDDLLTVQRNTGVRFGELSLNPFNGRWLLYLTFTLNSIWTGQEVWSYHLVNLVVHVINGVLAFFLAEVIFEKTGMDRRRAYIWACLAGCFFLVHPLQTESVTYISSRSELLSATFYLLALLVFVKWPVERIGFLLSLLVAVPFFLGLSTKETDITLPAAIFLYDFIFISRGSFRPMFARWRFYSVFAIGGVAATYYIATVILRDSIGPGLVGHLSTRSYFLTQLRVVTRYVYIVFFPVGLNLDYDFKPSSSAFQPAVIASLLFLASVLALGWFLRKRQPIFAFSILWFFLTLAPTSSFVPILDVIFEHRLYLPMVGVCLSFPAFWELLSNQFRNRLGYVLNPQVAAVLWLGVLTSATIYRNYLWEDNVRLYTDIVSKSPYKPRAYNGLGWSYFQKADYENGLRIMRKAIEMIPGNRNELADTLGNMMLKTQRYDDAIRLFEEVAQTEKDRVRLAIIYNNLGVSYLYKWKQLHDNSSRISQEAFQAEKARILLPAAEAFRKSVEADNQFLAAADSGINVANELGTTDRMEAEARTRLQAGENFADLYTIGKIAFLKEDFKRADEYFERAEKVSSSEKLIYFNHGYTKDRLKLPIPAIEKYTEALRLDPMFSEAHYNVGLIYMEQGDNQKAIENFTGALQFDPNNILANVNIAKVYANIGNRDAARQHLRTVLNTSPGNEMAVKTWKELGF